MRTMASREKGNEQDGSSGAAGAADGADKQRTVWERLSLGPVLAVLAVVGFAGFILFSVDVEPISRLSETVREEMASKLLQLAVLSVAGAVLAILTFEYQRRQKKADDVIREDRERQERTEREARQKRETQAREERQRAREAAELLKEMLGRAMTAYNMTKGARRMIRARSGSGRLGLDDYDRYMAEINSAQLEFERVKRDAKLVKGRLPGADHMATTARAMEKYLNGLLSEYQKRRHLVDATGFELAAFSRLSDFIAKRNQNSGFFAAFADPFSAARKEVRQELLRLDDLNAAGPEALDADDD